MSRQEGVWTLSLGRQSSKSEQGWFEGCTEVRWSVTRNSGEVAENMSAYTELGAAVTLVVAKHGWWMVGGQERHESDGAKPIRQANELGLQEEVPILQLSHHWRGDNAESMQSLEGGHHSSKSMLGSVVFSRGLSRAKLHQWCEVPGDSVSW